MTLSKKRWTQCGLFGFLESVLELSVFIEMHWVRITAVRRGVINDLSREGFCDTRLFLYEGKEFSCFIQIPLKDRTRQKENCCLWLHAETNMMW